MFRLRVLPKGRSPFGNSPAETTASNPREKQAEGGRVVWWCVMRGVGVWWWEVMLMVMLMLMVFVAMVRRVGGVGGRVGGCHQYQCCVWG